jgi:hypothetical protein
MRTRLEDYAMDGGKDGRLAVHNIRTSRTMRAAAQESLRETRLPTASFPGHKDSKHDVPEGTMMFRWVQ